jgi:hypothetical protein
VSTGANVRRGCNTRSVLLLLAAAFCIAAEPTLAADEDDFDRTPAKCVHLSRIDRTEVIDEHTILFYMTNRAIYRNYLPEACSGLKPHDSFMYTSITRELCDTDYIQVLHGWGSGLHPGRTCNLGTFYPVTPEEVEELKSLPGPPKVEANKVDPKQVDSSDPEKAGETESGH